MFPVIIINYLTASVWGYILTTGHIEKISYIVHESWFPMTIVIGLLLIVMFHVIGFSTQYAGLTVTSVATRMSFIIPMLFSIIYYNEETNIVKTTGISLAISAVLLSSIKKNNNHVKGKYILLPLILFLGAGIIDSSIKYCQHQFQMPEISAIFTGFLFFISFLFGLFILFAKRTYIRDVTRIKVIIAGILLGTFNYGSIFFLVNALSKSGIDSSVVFGINNTGIVALSVMTGITMFKEKITLINWLGVILGIIAIFILMY